jgi:DNA polymerase III epsilon subunit-like protein
MQVARVYLDVETTGLDRQYHSVIEVGGVAVSRDGAELACFGSLVNPGDWAMRNSEPRAFEVNEIDPKEVRAARPIHLVAVDFSKWLCDHLGVLHAFAVEFDQGFLSVDPWKVGHRWGECIQQASRNIMARHGALPIRYGKPKLPRLTEAAEFFGVTVVRSHRALDDARTTARLHTEILRRRELEPIVDEADHLIQEGM